MFLESLSIQHIFLESLSIQHIKSCNVFNNVFNSASTAVFVGDTLKRVH